MTENRALLARAGKSPDAPPSTDVGSLAAAKLLTRAGGTPPPPPLPAPASPPVAVTEPRPSVEGEPVGSPPAGVRVTASGPGTPPIVSEPPPPGTVTPPTKLVDAARDTPWTPADGSPVWRPKGASLARAIGPTPIDPKIAMFAKARTDKLRALNPDLSDAQIAAMVDKDVADRVAQKRAEAAADASTGTPAGTQ